MQLACVRVYACCMVNHTQVCMLCMHVVWSGMYADYLLLRVVYRVACIVHAVVAEGEAGESEGAARCARVLQQSGRQPGRGSQLQAHPHQGPRRIIRRPEYLQWMSSQVSLGLVSQMSYVRIG